MSLTGCSCRRHKRGESERERKREKKKEKEKERERERERREKERGKREERREKREERSEKREERSETRFFGTRKASFGAQRFSHRPRLQLSNMPARRGWQMPGRDPFDEDWGEQPWPLPLNPLQAVLDVLWFIFKKLCQILRHLTAPVVSPVIRSPPPRPSRRQQQHRARPSSAADIPRPPQRSPGVPEDEVVAVDEE